MRSSCALKAFWNPHHCLKHTHYGTKSRLKDRDTRKSTICGSPLPRDGAFVNIFFLHHHPLHTPVKYEACSHQNTMDHHLGNIEADVSPQPAQVLRDPLMWPTQGSHRPRSWGGRSQCFPAGSSPGNVIYKHWKAPGSVPTRPQAQGLSGPGLISACSATPALFSQQ